MGDRSRTEPGGAGTALAETGEEEAALIARAKLDPRAFAPLYRRYAGQIYGYCHHRLDSREAAEDATSQIFAKALGSLSTCRGESVRGWLFGIAHHVVADRYRERAPDAPLEAAGSILDVSPSPEELAEAGDAPAGSGRRWRTCRRSSGGWSNCGWPV